ncbi:MAG: hypothetical protein R3B13_39330 [Polyangiaceae bacterium]
MRSSHSALAVGVTMLWLCFSSRIAHADAVPPEPENCPKGTVGVTDHGGPRCEPEAPKNCAPGYVGAVGGSCVLARCNSDDQCESGRRCRQIDVCQEYRELRWTGWGWSAQRPASRDNVLGEPPGPQPPGPPKKDWVPSGICGQDGPCAAPSECRPLGLCYPADRDSKVPATNGPVTGGPVTGGPGKPGAGKSAAADDSGGCRRGCEASASQSTQGWLGLGLVLLAGARRRKARAQRS